MAGPALGLRRGMTDPHGLERFVAAQNQAGTFATAVAELRGGRKRSHWMWFVFPQIAGLGHSPISRRTRSRRWTRLGRIWLIPCSDRGLTECARILGELEGRTAQEIFGGIDAIKLRSSMTLFARADSGQSGVRAACSRRISAASPTTPPNGCCGLTPDSRRIAKRTRPSTSGRPRAGVQ